jgi:hypothetical protein
MLCRDLRQRFASASAYTSSPDTSVTISSPTAKPIVIAVSRDLETTVLAA